MNQEIQQYQSDDAGITLDVRVENDTVWLTQSQMALLFSRDISVISRHIRNIFPIGELEQKGICIFCKLQIRMNFQLVRISYKLREIVSSKYENKCYFCALNQKEQ